MRSNRTGSNPVNPGDDRGTSPGTGEGTDRRSTGGEAGYGSGPVLEGGRGGAGRCRGTSRRRNGRRVRARRALPARPAVAGERRRRPAFLPDARQRSFVDLDLGLLLQLGEDLLQPGLPPLEGEPLSELLLRRLERNHRGGNALVKLDQVVAVLVTHDIADPSRLEGEGGRLELRGHLPAEDHEDSPGPISRG